MAGEGLSDFTQGTASEIYAAAANYLSGSTLRCVDFAILAYCGTYNEYQISPDDCVDQYDQFGEPQRRSGPAS